MTLSITAQASPLGAKLVQQTVANATANNNVTGAPGVLYMVDIDNTSNPAVVYLKLFDATAPTIGGEAPSAADWVFKVPASARRVIGIPEGFSFAVGLSFAVVTQPNESALTSPGNPVIVRLLTS